MYILGTDSKSDPNSQSNGAVLATACVVTFIVTLTTTFIVVYIFVKNKFASTAKDTTSKQQQQPAATTATVIYDTVGPPNQKTAKADMEIINPAYNKSHKVNMNTNPAYESCKQ